MAPSRSAASEGLSLCLLVACLLPWLYASGSAIAAQPCKRINYGSVDARLLHRKILVSATINDHDVVLALDTGAVSTSISSAVARRLLLTLGTRREEAYTIGGAVPFSWSTPTSLQIGNIAAQNMRISVQAPRDHSDEVYEGVLGRDILATYDLEIDLASKRIWFFSPESCGEKIVSWADDWFEEDIHRNPTNSISISPRLNSHVLPGTLDSGAFRTIISWSVARELGITPETRGVTPDGQGSSAAGGFGTISRYVLETLEIGGEKLSHYPIGIVDYKMLSYPSDDHRLVVRTLSLETLIGVDFLMMNHVYIAWRDSKLYFTPYEPGQTRSLFAAP